MKPMRLDVDSLKVTSFPTGRGGVMGHGTFNPGTAACATQFNCATSPGQATCGQCVVYTQPCTGDCLTAYSGCDCLSADQQSCVDTCAPC